VAVTAGIPAAPRQVRWRPCLARNFGLGVAGAILLVTGLLLVVAMRADTGSLLPFDDLALDGGASRATARVLARERTSMHSPAGDLWRIRYEFTDQTGVRRGGASYTPAPAVADGDDVEAEFLADDPDVHRLRGTLRAPFPTLAILFTTGTAIGLALLLVWLRGVLRTRILLREGELGEATVVAARRVRGLNPPTLRADYELQVPGGTLAGRQFVRAASPLGALVCSAGRVPAVHDEDDPARHRLVHPSDFVAS
jgi:hypothetical protein